MTDPLARDLGAPDDPKLDRTISPIAGRLSSARSSKALTFGGLLAGCAVLALATYGADRREPPAPAQRPARQVVAFEPAPSVLDSRSPPTLASPGPDAPRLVDSDTEFVPAIAAEPPAVEVPGQHPPRRAAASGSAPLMAYSRSGGPGGVLPASMASREQPGDPAGTELDRLRRGSRIGRVAASPIGDRNFLILAGATLPCVLQTAMDTATSGYVTCVIGSDVYSDNGAVVLLEKGARVLGEYQSGMRRGQSRIFVLWTRAVTPRGVAIDLSSPASDALGRAGFGGVVDTHFWDRFGAALLLSIVDEGGEAFRDDRGRSGSARLPSDAAASAVEQGRDIAPTLRKPQGAEVAIQVAQDLDFSDVYGLKARP